MFESHKKPHQTDVVAIIQNDLAALNAQDPKHNLEKLNTIVRSTLKGAIGRPHEYTFEESLFILKEEKVIEHDVYEHLKKVLMQLVFVNYAHYDGEVLNTSIQHIITTFSQLIPHVLAKVDTNQCATLYQKEMQQEAPSTSDKHHLLTKQHKQEILEAQHRILEEFDQKFSASQTQSTPEQSTSKAQTVQIPFSHLFSKATGFALHQQPWLNEQDHTTQIQHLQKRIEDISQDTQNMLLGEYYPYKNLALTILHCCIALLHNQTIAQTIAYAQEKNCTKEAIMHCLSHMLLS